MKEQGLSKLSPTNQLDNIHHVAIPVLDINASVEWYKENFNCQIIYRDETWAFLEFANIKLALVTPNQHPPHIAFVSQTAEKFGTLVEHRDKSRSTYIKDPSGNTVEVIAED
jgi:catechol 2,3-dioxygenase-like lactoylglutathione lyase family enzyme